MGTTEVCPKCGGKMHLETRYIHNREGVIHAVQILLCASCGYFEEPKTVGK